MKGDLGTILYIVFLIIITFAGIFKKKKKVDAEVLKKKMAQQQAQAKDEHAPAEKETSRGRGERILTGNPLVDALLNPPEESYVQEEEEFVYEAPAGEQEKHGAEEPEVFLPPEEEGKSALAGVFEKKTLLMDENRIVADHPDWEKFMEELDNVERSEFMEEFDPVKAVIYSEIMERKYF